MLLEQKQSAGRESKISEGYYRLGGRYPRLRPLDEGLGFAKEIDPSGDAEESRSDAATPRRDGK